MASIFTITTPTQSIEIGGTGQGSIVFSVKNNAERSVSVRCVAQPTDASTAGWLRIEGSDSFRLDVGETAQVVVLVEVPAGSTAGSYSCRLKVYDTERPDEDYSEGQSAVFIVQRPTDAENGRKQQVWIFAGLLVLLLVAGGAVVSWLIRPIVTPAPAAVEVPSFIGKSAEAARDWGNAHDVVIDESNEESDQAPPGAILSQEPNAGEVQPGASVRIVVAEAHRSVPLTDFVDSQLKLLRDWADGHGIQVTETERPSHAKQGTVLEQDPRDGLIFKGEVLEVVVAVPFERVPVRNFRGLNVEQARAWANEHGIHLEQSERASEEMPGTVLAQAPATGTIDAGAALWIAVAVPPAEIEPKGPEESATQEPARPLPRPGETIVLQTQAQNYQGQYLNMSTTKGTLKVYSSKDHTGSKWRIVEIDGHTYLQTQGVGEFLGRYLALSSDGKRVYMTASPANEAQWNILPIGDSIVLQNKASKRFLTVSSTSGNVWSTTDLGHTGTKWRVE